MSFLQATDVRNFRTFMVHSVWDEQRGSYMSVHVLLNLLNDRELEKRDKMHGLPSNYCFHSKLINSIIHEHKC